MAETIFREIKAGSPRAKYLLKPQRILIEKTRSYYPWSPTIDELVGEIEITEYVKFGDFGQETLYPTYEQSIVLWRDLEANAWIELVTEYKSPEDHDDSLTFIRIVDDLSAKRFIRDCGKNEDDWFSSLPKENDHDTLVSINAMVALASSLKYPSLTRDVLHGAKKSWGKPEIVGKGTRPSQWSYPNILKWLMENHDQRKWPATFPESIDPKSGKKSSAKV